MKRAEEKERIAQKKVSLLLEIDKYGGLWKNTTEMEINFKKVKDEKKKIYVLYTQLQFHHVVLNSKAPKSFFPKITLKKRKKSEFSSREMCKHLTDIIKLNIDEHDIEQDLSDLTAILDAPEEQPVFTAAAVNARNDEYEAQKVKLFEKLKESRVKRKSKKSKNLLEGMLLCPEKLVACHIKHKVQQTEDNIPERYDGMVIKIENKHKISIKDTIQGTI